MLVIKSKSGTCGMTMKFRNKLRSNETDINEFYRCLIIGKYYYCTLIFIFENFAITFRNYLVLIIEQEIYMFLFEIYSCYGSIFGLCFFRYTLKRIIEKQT